MSDKVVNSALSSLASARRRSQIKQRAEHAPVVSPVVLKNAGRAARIYLNVGKHGDRGFGLGLSCRHGRGLVGVRRKRVCGPQGGFIELEHVEKGGNAPSLAKRRIPSANVKSRAEHIPQLTE
jgi:hypothetical protein